MPSSPYLFVSYSREDSWECRAVVSELLLAGFRVWVDSDIEPGTADWKKDLDHAVKQSVGVVCICSPAAASSKWVATELLTALTHQKSIYPVWVKGSSADESIPTAVASVQATDARTNYRTSIDKLLIQLTKRHEDARVIDLRRILDPQGIRWLNFGSLFWFASEIRKLRLLFQPEAFGRARASRSLAQLAHHAERLNIDKYSRRDITNVLSALESMPEEPVDAQRKAIEAKLRQVQDNVARQAELIDASFSDGPAPGGPIDIHRS